MDKSSNACSNSLKVQDAAIVLASPLLHRFVVGEAKTIAAPCMEVKIITAEFLYTEIGKNSEKLYIASNIKKKNVLTKKIKHEKVNQAGKHVGYNDEIFKI